MAWTPRLDEYRCVVASNKASKALAADTLLHLPTQYPLFWSVSSEQDKKGEWRPHFLDGDWSRQPVVELHGFRFIAHPKFRNIFSWLINEQRCLSTRSRSKHPQLPPVLAQRVQGWHRSCVDLLRQIYAALSASAERHAALSLEG
jgi:hypothetical protein